MRVGQEILGVLAAVECNGHNARLAAQLDRKTYVAVNKVLEACGGRWDRKAGAHVFREDAQAILDAVLNAGEVRTAREDGWFPTPPDLAKRVVEAARIEPGHAVLEPSAGEGALVSAVLAAVPTAKVVWVERDAGRAEKLRALNAHGVCGDFLTVKPEAFDRVVMNPPFSATQDAHHVLHAYRMLRPRGRLVAIVSAGVAFRRGAAYDTLRALVQRHGTLEPLPEGAFKSAGTNVRTSMLTLDAPAVPVPT